MGGAESLLAELLAAEVRLWIEGGRLGFDGPVTHTQVDRMRSHRDELLGLVERFEERAAVAEHDGQLSRADAEAMAIADLMGDRVGDGSAKNAGWGPGWLCPTCCRGDRLADRNDGWHCLRCDRPAWRWVGDSFVRCDWIEPPMIEAAACVGSRDNVPAFVD